MKFGDTLVQRSVPQWRNYNVDYSTLKTHFKNPTSYSSVLFAEAPAPAPAGNGKGNGESQPVSIPMSQPNKGSRNKGPINVEERLFSVLKTEHDRVGLFVRSKCYEIESRLNSIERLLKQLQKRRALAETAAKPKNTLKLRQKFSKVESDILRLGNEIQNLSRFIAINKLAIRKLLNKYSKSSGSRAIAERAEQELLNNSESFAQIHLGDALSRYTDFLHAVRVPFSGDHVNPTIVGDGPVTLAGTTNQQSQRELVPTYVAERALRSDTDFDTILSEPDAEYQATYWVHIDNVVELRILLLQYMRYAEFDKELISTLRRKSSKLDSVNDQSCNCGAIVVSPRADARNAESMRADGPSSGRSLTVTPRAPILRWAISDGKILSIQTAREENTPDQPSRVKLKGGDLSTLLRIIRFSITGGNASTSDDDYMSQSEDELRTSSSMAKYLGKGADGIPSSCTFYKRSRFIGLENNDFQIHLAALDENPEFISLLDHTKRSNFGQTNQFPHAVLTVKYWGQDNCLIRTLNRSHLTEAVSGFSLESHASGICNRNQTYGEDPPQWLSKLDKDIRHIPAEVPSLPSPRSITPTSNFNASNERLTSTSSDNLQTPNLTSRSGTSGSGPVTPNTVTFVNNMGEQRPSWMNMEAGSNDSVQNSSNSQPRQVTLLPNHPSPQRQPTQRKYWNEYDHPGSDAGDGHDESFYIYIDKDAPLFPGQGMLLQWSKKIREFLSFRPRGDNRDPETGDVRPVTNGKRIGSLRPRASNLSSSSSDEQDISDMNAEADDELSQATALLQDANLRDPDKRLLAGELKSDANGRGGRYGTFSTSNISSRFPQAVNIAPSSEDDDGRGWMTLPTLSILASVATLTVMSALLHAARISFQGLSQAKVAILIGVAAALAFVLLSFRQAGEVGQESGDSLESSVRPQIRSRGIVRTMAAILICVWAGVLVALVVVI